MKIKPFFVVLLSALISAPSVSQAQKFMWNLDFDSQFDNREYNSELTKSQTLFGVRLTPEVGIGWGKGNSIKAGGNFLFDFGAKAFERDPELILYYGYESPKFNVYAGLMPRTKLIGTYSYAIFSDSTRFYDANLDGLVFQYQGRNGYLEFVCDWNSMVSGTRREKFQVFSSGMIQTASRRFYGGYNIAMYHHAGSEEERGVVDNSLFLPYVGLNLSKTLSLDSLVLQVGWLQGYHRDRRFEGKTRLPGGVQVVLRLEKWRVGIDNTLYLGDGQMPFYAKYGNDLYMGEPFYRTTSDVYNRFELYWNLLRRNDMDLRLSTIHHYDGRSWSWQQMIRFSVAISDKMFRKKR